MCPGVRRERELPPGSEVPAEPDWLDPAPAGLHDHLDRALGTRTSAVVQAVCAALDAGRGGDEDYQDALQGSSAYYLDDDDASAVFDGPVAVVTGAQDRVVGTADQLRRMAVYPRGTYLAADLAGHYLPFERPALLRSTALDWLQRCGVG